VNDSRRAATVAAALGKPKADDRLDRNERQCRYLLPDGSAVHVTYFGGQAQAFALRFKQPTDSPDHALRLAGAAPEELAVVDLIATAKSWEGTTAGVAFDDLTVFTDAQQVSKWVRVEAKVKGCPE